MNLVFKCISLQSSWFFKSLFSKFLCIDEVLDLIFSFFFLYYNRCNSLFYIITSTFRQLFRFCLMTCQSNSMQFKITSNPSMRTSLETHYPPTLQRQNAGTFLLSGSVFPLLTFEWANGKAIPEILRRKWRQSAAATPTCITWGRRLCKLHHNPASLDKFKCFFVRVVQILFF